MEELHTISGMQGIQVVTILCLLLVSQGFAAPDRSSGLLDQKWYSVYVGTQPGLYPGS